MQMLQEVIRQLARAAMLIAACSISSEVVAVDHPLISSRDDCLLVTNGEVATHNERRRSREVGVPELERANAGHEIQAGHSLVFVLRQYRDDGRGPDSAKFAKTTLTLLPKVIDLAVGQDERIAVSAGAYTEGGVGFIHRGRYWRAKDPVSKIAMKRTAEGLFAEIHTTFLAERASDHKTRTIHLDVTCTVRNATPRDLDPWEGKVGAGWESFAPNR